MMRSRLLVYVLLFFLPAPVLEAQTRDRVRLQNAGSEEKGVLVDGYLGGVDVNDKTYTSPDVGSFFSSLFPSVILDNLSSSAQSNEVIAFTKGRPPTLRENVFWSTGSNTLDLTLESEYRIPVNVYIVQGDFEEGRQRAVEHSVETSTIWWDERQGVAFSSFQIHDGTQNEWAQGVDSFNCDLQFALREQIGADPETVNVYYVDRVLMDAGPTEGGAWHCGATYTIIMARRTTGGVLAHELGHAFYLSHPDDLSDFDDSNVMWPYVGSTRHLTEGQTFRAIFEPWSAINNVYHLRPGMTVRSCPHSNSSDNECSALRKRIWADGDHAPN